MRNRLLKLLLIAFLLGGGATKAQDQDQDQDHQQDDQAAGQEHRQAAEEQAEAQQEESTGESGEETEEDDGFERFIPTEQVSRDLGVSFPADI